MKTEEEIMLDRRIRGMGLTVLGLLISFIFINSLRSGQFESLRHLNNKEGQMICCTNETEPVLPETGNSAVGEQLFKAHCSSCHIPWADAAGPALKGARGRWIRHSSEENFYMWIKNSQLVIDSGDPYANTLYKKWNGVRMPVINLTNEEIDEIFIYIN